MELADFLNSEYRKSINISDEDAAKVYKAVKAGDTDLLNSLGIDNDFIKKISECNGLSDYITLIPANKIDLMGINEKGLTLLQQEIINGNINTVKQLIDKGANINVIHNSLGSPLMFSIIRGHDDISELLIEKGADINLVNDNGLSALHMAAYNGNSKIVEMLINKGADINLKCHKGNTPFLQTIPMGHVLTAEILLKNGADINAQNSNGTTAIIGAIIKENIEMTKLLIDYQADISIKNEDGNNAIDYAEMFEVPLHNLIKDRDRNDQHNQFPKNTDNKDQLNNSKQNKFVKALVFIAVLGIFICFLYK